MNQRLVVHQSIIRFFLFFLFLTVHEINYCRDLIVVSDGIVHKEVLTDYFIEYTIVNDLSFESDIVFQEEEFFHLIGFKTGDQINKQDIIFSLERFIKKNKFSSIKIRASIDSSGVCLHFIFESAWTFKKVKIHNFYQKKQILSQLYLMERGDFFDETKHNHSLFNIKEFLMSKGYCDHYVMSNFEYIYQTKEILVHIFIKRGKPFCFGTSEVEIIFEDETYNDQNVLQQSVKKKLMHALASHAYDREELNNQIVMLKDYLAKKGFLYSDIEVAEYIDRSCAEVNMNWKIIIYQKRDLIFSGNRFFSKKQLLDKILAFGQSVLILPASLLAEEIIHVYKDKGFLDVEVVTREEKECSFFVIKEGSRAIIKDVVIKNATLDGSLSIKKRCFGKLLKNTYFDTQLYDEAINLLTNIYFEQGFLSFAVIERDFIHTQENEYVLSVVLDEGVQKYITKVSIEGYPELDQCDFFTKITKEHVPFNNKIIDEQRLWLMNYFQSLGYMYPRFKVVIEQIDRQVSLKWIADLGEKVCFGKTVVLGNSSFPFSCIESLLCYEEGGVWDQKKVKQTFKALKELEIFETICFSADRDTHEKRSVLLKLHLDDRYEIRTRAGLELQHVRKYQTFSGLTYKIGGTVLIKNPSNCADQIRFDCDFARSHREIVGKYRRPWFTRNPFFSILQVYSITYDQPGFIGSSNNIYTLMQHGFLLGIQKKGSYGDASFNSGFEWMKLRIRDNEAQLLFAQAIDFEPQLIDKTVPFFFIEPVVIFERLDNALNPTQGGISLLSLKGMIPLKKKYKDSVFFKMLCEQSIFIPITSIVIALRFRCGHIFYREFSGIMPSERFYLGGSHSLRGYEADLAPPLGVFEDDEGKQHVVPRGGRTMANVNGELRFSLYKKIGAVIFQDLGALSGTMFADFKSQDILASTGFGLRIHTPLGPLRFDIGWKWRKYLPVERSFAWFLTFGQAF